MYLMIKNTVVNVMCMYICTYIVCVENEIERDKGKEQKRERLLVTTLIEYNQITYIIWVVGLYVLISFLCFLKYFFFSL